MARNLRNIAIIAHVDHGKTTLVDKLLQQSGTFAAHQQIDRTVMDSNDLEKERGITILAKNTAIDYKGTRINIVDTPGHADFGGEVERVLGMVDGVVLLVDAVEGPMPQTRFVTKKALALGLHPIVVINKVDRPGARPDWVVDQTFDLFDKLHATDEQLDFPVVYASAPERLGLPRPERRDMGGRRRRHESAVRNRAESTCRSAQAGDSEAPLQLQIARWIIPPIPAVSALAACSTAASSRARNVVVMNHDDQVASGRINQVLGFKGLERVPVEEALKPATSSSFPASMTSASASPSADRDNAGWPAEMLSVDEPTLTMDFMVNSSPLAGTEGKFVTSRQIRDRLNKELLTNVALRVEDTGDADMSSAFPAAVNCT
jgi:GTP-binding protein